MLHFEKNIIYSDNHIILAYKKPGLLSQKDQTGDDSILEHIKRFVAEKYNKKGKVFLGSVHRLDRPAAGLMIFAKTSKALTRLNESFRKGEVEKEYLAVLEDCPDTSGNLVHYLLKDTKKNRVACFKTPVQGAKKAILSYELIGHQKTQSLVKIKLLTGRPHQIRAQFSFIGNPIVGDLKYGSSMKTPDQSICLLSWGLSFIHPVTKELLNFRSPYPGAKYWDQFSMD